MRGIKLYTSMKHLIINHPFLKFFSFELLILNMFSNCSYFFYLFQPRCCSYKVYSYKKRVIYFIMIVVVITLTSQSTHDVASTSIVTSYRRLIDVETTSCVYWDKLILYQILMEPYISLFTL